MNRGSLIQEVSGVYTSPFLDADELKIALRARKVPGAFEKRPQVISAQSSSVVITSNLS